MKPLFSIPLIAVIASMALASCSGGSQTSSRKLEQTCISEDIRPRLKDPQSLRVLNREHDNAKAKGTYEQGNYTDFVYISYTATNGYGGRVKNTRNCGFIGKTLVMAMNGERGESMRSMDEADFILYRGDLVE